jgi:hypothetical protein
LKFGFFFFKRHILLCSLCWPQTVLLPQPPEKLGYTSTDTSGKNILKAHILFQKNMITMWFNKSPKALLKTEVFGISQAIFNLDKASFWAFVLLIPKASSLSHVDLNFLFQQQENLVSNFHFQFG